MEKPKKMREPLYDTKFCDRCEQSYCVGCVDFPEVDFDVKEIVNEHHPNPKAERFEVKWKGNDVCVWCYNQLIDKAFPPN